MRKADEGLGGDHRARSDPRHSGLPEPNVACSAAGTGRPRAGRVRAGLQRSSPLRRLGQRPQRAQAPRRTLPVRPAVTLAAQPQRPRGHRPLKSPPRAGVLPSGRRSPRDQPPSPPRYRPRLADRGLDSLTLRCGKRSLNFLFSTIKRAGSNRE